MNTPLFYDFRDVLIAPARALSAKRIFVMTLFLVVGIVVYDILAYLAVAVDGQSVGRFWDLYGLLPLKWLHFGTLWAEVIYGLGLVLGVLALMLGFFAVSAFEMEQIRGNRFFSIGASVRFTLSRLGQLITAEVSILAFVALIVVLFLVLGLVTRIPYIGEWIYSITFLIPGFIIAIFTVFIFAVLQVSVVLLPSTAAAEHNGESFTAILETFSTVIRQPVRWVLYTAYGLTAAKVCSWVYAYFCYRAVQFVAWSVSITAGDKGVDVVRSGLSHLPLRSDLVRGMLEVFPGVDWSFSVSQWVGRTDYAAGHLMAVMLFLIFASIIGYALAVVATAQARGYAVIRYLKDDYKIEDEKPLFFEEEWVNPKSGEGEGGSKNM